MKDTLYAISNLSKEKITSFELPSKIRTQLYSIAMDEYSCTKDFDPYDKYTKEYNDVIREELNKLETDGFIITEDMLDKLVMVIIANDSSFGIRFYGENSSDKYIALQELVKGYQVFMGNFGTDYKLFYTEN